VAAVITHSLASSPSRLARNSPLLCLMGKLFSSLLTSPVMLNHYNPLWLSSPSPSVTVKKILKLKTSNLVVTSSIQNQCNIRVPTPLFISRSWNVPWYKSYVVAYNWTCRVFLLTSFRWSHWFHESCQSWMINEAAQLRPVVRLPMDWKYLCCRVAQLLESRPIIKFFQPIYVWEARALPKKLERAEVFGESCHFHCQIFKIRAMRMAREVWLHSIQEFIMVTLCCHLAFAQVSWHRKTWEEFSGSPHLGQWSWDCFPHLFKTVLAAQKQHACFKTQCHQERGTCCIAVVMSIQSICDAVEWVIWPFPI
jgi:hypothetical protein